MRGDLTEIIHTLTSIVTLSTLWGLVLLVFFWNLMQLILSSGNAEKRKQAIPRLVWSIIAITVLFSIGGILGVLQQTFFGSNL